MSDRQPFMPVRDDQRPYWQVIYDEVVDRIDQGKLQVGEVITSGELESILGPGVEWRQPTLKAAKMLRETRQRSLDSVRGVGYKLVAGIDQVKQGKRVRRRAGRALERAQQHYQTVDRRLLSMDQSTKLDLALAGTAVLVSWAKETDERMVQVEDDIAALKNHRRESTVQQRATADEVAELRKRLDSLESEK